jgi:hypothetical protein
VLPAPLAERVNEDDDRSLQSHDGLFLDEHRFESGTLGSRYVTSKRLAIRDNAGAPRYIINVVEDVTERRRADEKIAHLAHYDALTDLPNRVLFREQIDRELRKAAKGGQFAPLYIDIDEFKGRLGCWITVAMRVDTAMGRGAVAAGASLSGRRRIRSKHEVGDQYPFCPGSHRPARMSASRG